MMLPELPVEILHEIVDQCQPYDVLNLRMCCQQFYNVITPLIWSHVYLYEQLDSSIVPTFNQFFNKNCEVYCENPYELSTHHNCIKWCILLAEKDIDDFADLLVSGHYRSHLSLAKLIHFHGYTDGMGRIMNILSRSKLPKLQLLEIYETKKGSRDLIESLGLPIFANIEKRIHMDFTSFACSHLLDIKSSDITAISIQAPNTRGLANIKRRLMLKESEGLPPHVKYAALTSTRLKSEELRNFLKDQKYLKLLCKVEGPLVDWVPTSAVSVDFRHDYDLDMESLHQQHQPHQDGNEHDNMISTSVTHPSLTTTKLEGDLAASTILMSQFTNLQRLSVSRVLGDHLVRYFHRFCRQNHTFFDDSPNLRQLTFEYNTHHHIIECMKQANTVKSLIIRKGGDPGQHNCDLYQLVRLCTNLDFFLHEGTYEALPTSVLAYFSFYCPNLNKFYVVSPKHGLPFGIPSRIGPLRGPLHDGYSLIQNLEDYYMLDMNGLCANRRKVFPT